MADTSVEGLLKSACDFQALSIESRKNSSVAYRQKETDAESSLRIIIDGLMASLAENMKMKVENTDEKISYQIVLSASYVRSHFIINDMILHSDLVEAYTLIRKQLESLTRLHELDSKPLQKLIRRTPDVISTFKAMGKKAYPHLSEIAHFASPKAGELLHILDGDGSLVGPSMVPIYTEAAHGCFDIQALVSLYFLFWFIDKQKDFYPNFKGDDEEKILFTAFQLALDENIIRVNDNSKA